MRKSFLLIGAALASASIAAATDYPRAEVFAGYNFVRFNPDSPFVPSFNANGGSGEFQYNFKSWIAGVFDAGAVNKGTINITDPILGVFPNVDATVVNFVAGPRFTLRKFGRIQPFAHALFGGAYRTVSIPVGSFPCNPGFGPPCPATLQFFPPAQPLQTFPAVNTGLNQSTTGFAMLIGGGVDIKLSKHFAFRPAQADYYLTRLPDPITGNRSNRNNFRYSAGVNFLFGKK